MNLFKEDLKEEDRVFCIFNHSIEGRITKKTNYHGMYVYSVKVDDEENFKKWFGFNSENVKFLHCHLRKIYTEVKTKCKKTKKKKQTLQQKSKKSLKKNQS